MRNEAKKRNRGYTLMEVVAVMTILAILAAIAIPVTIHYIEKADQTARDNTARTLFANAQSALSQARLGGGALPTPIDYVDVSGFPGLTEEEKAENKDNIGYLSLSKNEPDPASNALYRLLAPFQNDAAALSASILLEYNVITGNALSLFYSDTVDELGYNGAAYNVLNRDADSLAKGRVGYFGVDSTGKEEAPAASVEAVEVRIADYDGTPEAAAKGNNINDGKNYGLLCVECTLPAGGADEYRIDLIQQGVTVDSLAFRLRDVTASSLATALDTAYTTRAVNGKNCNVAMFSYARSDGRTVVVLVLDYAGKNGKFSIGTNYPTVKNGYLAARFTATRGEVSSSAVTPDAAHAYFAGETESAGGKTVYSVASPRHLNNIRLAADQAYQQTRSFAVQDYDAHTLLAFTPVPAFSGSYSGMTNTDAFVISDLSVAVNSGSAGLFAKIDGSGMVAGVTLENASITGGTLAGGIAALNEGQIRKCTILPGCTVLARTGNAGGVAGENKNAKIWNCYAAAAVTAEGADGSAGGIAGYSTGETYYCEVGTALADDGGVKLVGTPDYGARLSTDTPNYKPNGYSVKNDLVSVWATGTNGNAGGIVGRVDTGGYLRYCVNAAKVNANQASSSAGGLAGQINHVGQEQVGYHSYNAGSVWGINNAGGLFGYCNAKIRGCYNTGRVNVDAQESSYKSFSDYLFLPQNTSTQGGSRVGGLVGFGDENAELDTCYNAQFVFGHGAFGLMKGNVLNCRYLINIQNADEKDRGDSAGTLIPELKAADSIALRKLPTGNVNLYAGKLNVGSSGRYGVGPYAYTLPFISIADSYCTLGEDFHRTPYDKPLEGYADVSLEDHSDYSIDTEFYFLEDGVTLIHKNNDSDVRFDVTPAVLDAIAAASAQGRTEPVESTDGQYAYPFSRDVMQSSDSGVSEDDRPWCYKGYKNRYHVDNVWNNTNTAGQLSNGEPAELAKDAVVRVYVCEEHYNEVHSRLNPGEDGVYAWSGTIKKPIDAAGGGSGGRIVFESSNTPTDTVKIQVEQNLVKGNPSATLELFVNGTSAGSGTIRFYDNNGHDDTVTIGAYSCTLSRSSGGKPRVFSLEMVTATGFVSGDKVRFKLTLGGYTETSPEYTVP